MLRRWIVTTLLLSSCIISNAQAQQAGKSIVDRLAFFSSPGDDPRTAAPRINGNQGQIIQTAATSPRAPRDRSGRSAPSNRGSGNSLLSRFSLSGLLPKRDEPAQQEEAGGYPMPYDPADARAQQRSPQPSMAAPARSSTGQRTQVAQPQIATDQKRVNQRYTAPASKGAVQRPNPPRSAVQAPRPQQIINPSAPTRDRSASTARTAPPAASPTQPTQPTTPTRSATLARNLQSKPQAVSPAQTVRQSPTLDLRRGELQDALADLRRSNTAANTPSPIDPPSAVDDGSLPQYLSSSATTPSAPRASRTTVEANPVAQRMRKVDSLDLGDAFLADTDRGDQQPTSNALRSNSQPAAREDQAAETETADDPEPSQVAARASNSQGSTVAVKDEATPAAEEADFGASLNQWAAGRPSPSASSAPSSRAGNQLRATVAAARTRTRQSEAGADAEQTASPVANSTNAFAVDPQLTHAAPRSAKEESSRAESPVLLHYQQPLIVSRVEGPRQVVVGQTAEYKVVLTNSGNTPARELEAQVAIPAGAELVEAVAVNGRVEITRPEGDESMHVVRWQLFELAPSEKQSLDLKVVPRDGRAMKLGVRWSHAPVGAETLVQVQEPKLQIELNGAAEALYGKPQRYQLTLSNPGNGVAEQVELLLTPPGATDAESMRHTVGDLSPGQSKSIELELTPRDAGDLEIRAVAIAAGGLEASSVKKVLCRQPMLEVDWRGPDKKYAGSLATYFIRVRNPGTASTEAVDVRVQLPEGVELVSASDGHSVNARNHQIVWRTASLQPAQERFLQLRCRLTNPGAAELALSASTRDNELADQRSFYTEVVALADLKMEVSDPKGPIAVGEDAVYEVVIRNRGTTAATGVNVVALFSEGIDPTSVDGRQHQMRDGRVTFRPIDYLPAGENVTLKIHAAATSAGSHVFRAEVTCPDLDVKLSAEEVTRFFADEHQWDSASKAYADQPESPQRY